MGGGSSHEAHFLRCETRTAAAVEAHDPPAMSAVDERNPQLVTQGEWLQDVSVAWAALASAIGLDVQGADDPARPRQGSELINVVADELVAEEVRRMRPQDFVGHRTCHEQRGGVGGGEERGIRRHNAADPPEGRMPKKPGVEVALRE